MSHDHEKICSKCCKAFRSANCKIEDGEPVCWECSSTTIMGVCKECHCELQHLQTCSKSQVIKEGVSA